MFNVLLRCKYITIQTIIWNTKLYLDILIYPFHNVINQEIKQCVYQRLCNYDITILL